MLQPRLIPCLLVEDGGLTKTVRFGPGKYVGDPLNAVRIFNEKQADELMVLDISAARRGPDLDLIRALAAECRMPLCYGGGVTTARQVEEIVSLGVEKVALGTAAVLHPQVVEEAAAAVGSQSVVVVIDARRRRLRRGYEVYVARGRQRTGRTPHDLAQEMQRRGAGEIVIQSIDRDGTMQGYDMDLVASVADAVHCPLTVLGGAGSLDDVRRLHERFGLVGAACGSLFVFKGRFRAVLVNYPGAEERCRLLQGVSTWPQGS